MFVAGDRSRAGCGACILALLWSVQPAVAAAPFPDAGPGITQDALSGWEGHSTQRVGPLHTSHRQLLQDGSLGCEPGFFLPSSGCQQCADGRSLPNNFGICPAGVNSRTAATAPKGIPQPDQRPFLHGLFSNRMVLARNRRGIVFGYARPGTTVTVTLRRQSSGSQIKRVTGVANSAGRWSVRLGLLGSGLVSSGPFTLTASRPGYSMTRSDVLVGEVWLVSGQSNMAFALGDVITGSATFRARAQSELTAATDMKIRTFQVPRNFSTLAQTNVYGSWNVSSPATVERFSAIGYLLAKQLRSKLNVPIGILESDFGGTSITSWLPPETIQQIGGVPEQETDPTQNLYNGMISNLGRDFGGFDINGAVWYQGESDGGLTASNPLFELYQGLLEALLSTWRTTFGFPAMPFVIVQLAAYIPRYASRSQPFRSNLNHWPYVALRDGNAYLATAVDLGNDHIVHPPNKWDVALRVARQLSHNVYGLSDMQGGPTYRAATRNADGTVTLGFNDISSKLVLGVKSNTTVTTLTRVSGTAATCFQLQDQYGAWRNATAALLDNGVHVKVGPVAGVPTAAAIRYAWFDGWPGCNVYNSVQLPLVPFNQTLG